MKGQDIESQNFQYRTEVQTMPKLQILIIGDGQTGKSSLVHLLTSNKTTASKTQGCDIRVAIRQSFGKKYLLQFIDLSGEKAQRQYLDVYIARLRLQGIIFCFDVTNLKTLENLRKWILRLSRNCVVQEDNEESLETDTSEFSRQSSLQINEEQDSLIHYRNFKGIPIEEILQTPFIFVGCKMDLIPEVKQQWLRQQIQERIQSFYKKSNNFILLSNFRKLEYEKQFTELDQQLNRIFDKNNVEEFFIRDKIQSKIIPLDESFWKHTISTPLNKNLKILNVYLKHLCQKLMCKKRKH